MAGVPECVDLTLDSGEDDSDGGQSNSQPSDQDGDLPAATQDDPDSTGEDISEDDEFEGYDDDDDNDGNEQYCSASEYSENSPVDSFEDAEENSGDRASEQTAQSAEDDGFGQRPSDDTSGRCVDPCAHECEGGVASVALDARGGPCRAPQSTNESSSETSSEKSCSLPLKATAVDNAKYELASGSNQSKRKAGVTAQGEQNVGTLGDIVEEDVSDVKRQRTGTGGDPVPNAEKSDPVHQSVNGECSDRHLAYGEDTGGPGLLGSAPMRESTMVSSEAASRGSATVASGKKHFNGVTKDTLSGETSFQDQKDSGFGVRETAQLPFSFLPQTTLLDIREMREAVRNDADEFCSQSVSKKIYSSIKDAIKSATNAALQKMSERHSALLSDLVEPLHICKLQQAERVSELSSLGVSVVDELSNSLGNHETREQSTPVEGTGIDQREPTIAAVAEAFIKPLPGECSEKTGMALVRVHSAPPDRYGDKGTRALHSDVASSTTLDTLGTFLDMNSQADPPGVEGSSEEIDALISTIEEKAELSKRLGGRVSALKLRCRLACLSHEQQLQLLLEVAAADASCRRLVETRAAELSLRPQIT